VTVRPDPTRALYAISVAAQLTGLHPQSIRSYEDHGLVEPARTAGGTRRYSERDIVALNRISGLLDEGLNLAGVEAVLALEATNRALRAEIAELQSAAATRARGGTGAVARPAQADGRGQADDPPAGRVPSNDAVSSPRAEKTSAAPARRSSSSA
jgi:MerR family transcriptional regulator/heat shock protein HspR